MSQHGGAGLRVVSRRAAQQPGQQGRPPLTCAGDQRHKGDASVMYRVFSFEHGGRFNETLKLEISFPVVQDSVFPESTAFYFRYWPVVGGRVSHLMLVTRQEDQRRAS